jgi:hypothetical protein
MQLIIEKLLLPDDVNAVAACRLALAQFHTAPALLALLLLLLLSCCCPAFAGVLSTLTYGVQLL